MQSKEAIALDCYHRSEFRAVRRHVALAVGWDAAALFDHLLSLESYFEADRIERDGRFWFWRPMDELRAYMGLKRDALDGAIKRLEKAGLIHRKRVAVGGKIGPKMHWSCDVVNAENLHLPQSKCGKPAFATAENPHLLGGHTSTKENKEKNTKESDTLPGLEKAGAVRQERGDVAAVWEAFKRITGHTRQRLSDQRKRVITKWLKADPDNNPAKAEKLARGLMASEHHTANGYTEIEHCLRATNENRFLRLSGALRGKPETDPTGLEKARAEMMAQLKGGTGGVD